MSFNDIFKNSFLHGFTNGIDIATAVSSILITTVIALYLFFIYRLVTKETFYSQTFNISLIAMAVITAAIILTIQSNIVLSLGMVGALSIVRFRTAIKEPLDLVFLYWSISVGIICGAGLTAIAVVLTLVMSCVVVLMQKYPMRQSSVILVVNSTNIDRANLILETVKKYSKVCNVKSKNLTPTTLNMIIEVKLSAETELNREILKIDGTTYVSILSHDGEITA